MEMGVGMGMGMGMGMVSTYREHTGHLYDQYNGARGSLSLPESRSARHPMSSWCKWVLVMGI